jgi:hypothetical protein
MQRGEYRKDTAIEKLKGGGNNYQRGGHFNTIFAIPQNCISFPNRLPTQKKNHDRKEMTTSQSLSSPSP